MYKSKCVEMIPNPSCFARSAAFGVSAPPPPSLSITETALPRLEGQKRKSGANASVHMYVATYNIVFAALEIVYSVSHCD